MGSVSADGRLRQLARETAWSYAELKARVEALEEAGASPDEAVDFAGTGMSARLYRYLATQHSSALAELRLACRYYRPWWSRWWWALRAWWAGLRLG